MIKAAHYDEVEELLSNDPIVQAMAQGLAKVEREKLAYEDGQPRWEFMQKANAEYRERGGKGSGHDEGDHIGAVAHALLIVLDSGAVKVQEVSYHASRDSLSAWRDEDRAMAHASIVSKEPSLKEAKKALAHYMVDEAMSLLSKENRDWAASRAAQIFDGIKELAAAEFPGEKNWEALDFDADQIRFRLVRVAK
jgi:hypothetical protein